MQDIWETYRDQGLMVLSIGDGMTEVQAQDWIDTYGLTHPVLADPSRLMYPLFGDGSIPHNAVLDGEFFYNIPTRDSVSRSLSQP